MKTSKQQNLNPKEEILPLFRRCYQSGIDFCTTFLKEGDSVPQGHYHFVIDDINKIKKTVTGKKTLSLKKIPYFDILNFLEEKDSLSVPSHEYVNQLNELYWKYGILNDAKGLISMPFSKVLEEVSPRCLEASIIFQIFAQETKNSLLINHGYYSVNGFHGPHAYNIIIDPETKSDSPNFFLVDLVNPPYEKRNPKQIKFCSLEENYLKEIKEINPESLEIILEDSNPERYFLFRHQDLF